MKLRNVVVVFILLIFAMMALSSCKIGGNTTHGNDGSTNNDSENPVNVGLIWGKGVAPKILLDEYSSDNLDWNSWMNTFYYNCEAMPTLISDTAEESDNEIVIGKQERNISNKAYLCLESELAEFGNSEAEGWVIYTNGKSLAIAYDGVFAYLEAIKYFEENYLKIESLSSKAGVLASDFFETEEYVDDIREARRESELNALVPEIGEEAVEALKKLFSLYTDDLYKWIADLYDPTVGGFYFSNSGRNTEGFLPDIESTAQTIRFLSSAGLISGSTREAIPEEIGQQILQFAQSLQSSEDGYFYHPQWGKNITTARLGRDLGWATEMIQTFGGKPLYDAPNGIKGTLGAPGQISSASYLTESLSVSSVMAVSKIIGVSKSALPSQLKSLDAWATYIDGLNIPYNSYRAGNTLAAQHDLIKMAGEEYIEYLIDYLNDTQDPNTGLWEAADSSNDAYFAVDGLMKLASCYNYFEKPIPNSEAAIQSCISVVLNPDGDQHVCSVYNPWATLNFILVSTELSEGASRVEELRAIILPKVVELIEATIKKLVDYRMEDGGFAYLGNSVAPENMSQAALVGCASLAESDVNATCICSTGTVGNIFNVLGCTKVKLFGEEDSIVFFDRLANLGEIIKVPLDEEIVTVTFDDYDPDYATVDGGVVIDPSEFVKNTVSDYETEDGNYKWFASSVVEDPAPSSKGDLALRVETFLRKGETKNKADTASFTTFDSQGFILNKNCFVFDGEIYFDSFDNSSCVGQISFVPSAENGDSVVTLNVLKYSANGKTYLTVGEAYQGLDGKQDDKVASGIPTGEWVRLRIEIYQIDTNDGVDIKCKIYVNGKYKGTCDSGKVKNGKFVNREIGAVKYFHYRYSASLVYFDEVTVQAINKKYIPEDDYTNAPTGPQRVDFEDYMTYGDTTYLHAYDPASPEGTYGVQTVIGANGEETNAFVYDSNPGGGDMFRLYSYGSDEDGKITSANAFVYDADMKFDFNPDADNHEVKLLIGSVGSSSYYAYYMNISLDKNSGKIKIKDIGAEADGISVITDVNNGDWFHIRVEYYYISDTEMLVLTYVNSKLVYVSNNYAQKNKNDSSVWPVYDADKYTMPSGSKIHGIEKIMFVTFNKCDVTISIDNCIIRRLDLDVPVVSDEDYTSRFDKEITDIGGGDSPSVPGDNPGGGAGEGGGNEPGSGIVTPPPSQGDIVGNIPDGTWKE